MRRHHRTRGQALVEFALIFPLLSLVLGGIIVLGIGVFYQQQLNNAAREAARFAAIHSATSQCPTTSWRVPNLSRLPEDFDLGNYYDCDPPDLRWPEMTTHARGQMWGLSRSSVYFAACWSGYWDGPPNGNGYDAPPSDVDGTVNTFRDCHIGGVDPRTNASQLSCPPPLTTLADDEASDLAMSSAGSANQVTVYACYVWKPPLLGDLIGRTITMRAVITEAMQHQQ
jgi:TadE-like protein